MKNVVSIMLASFTGALFVFAGCAMYSTIQTNDMMNRPPSCEDLHVHFAQWDYNDGYGNDFHTVGRCARGMMHGEFSYMMNGVLVAKTKFIRNVESKTVCFVGKKHASQLNYCLSEAVQKMGRHLVPPPAPAPQPVAPVAPQPIAPAAPQPTPGTVMMIPAQPNQPGAVLMVPVQQGQDGGVLMVPAQPGQEGAVWMVPAPQGLNP